MKEAKGVANSLIKGLALTLGGGLAVGLGIKIGQSSTPPVLQPEPFDITPIADQMETLGNRIGTVENLLKDPGPLLVPTMHELEERVHAQASEVEQLRAAIQFASEQHDARIDSLGFAMSSLESKIPELIDHSIQPKFEELHERVQREMQDTANQTLEVFADRIQARVVEKITSIEGDLTRQSEAINDLRDYSLKTDQNLQRLLAGVENLADKINRKFEVAVEPARPAQRMAAAAPAAPPPPSAPATPQMDQASAVSAVPAVDPVEPVAPPPAPQSVPKPVSLAASTIQPVQGLKTPDFPSKIELGEPADVRPPREEFPIPGAKSFSGPEFEELLAQKSQSSASYRKAALAGGGLALTAMVVGGIELSGLLHKPASAHVEGKAAPNKMSATVPAADALDTKKLTDQSALLDQARTFSQKREYARAEQIYRSILKSDPANIEVKRLLASALFRQEKIEESVKVLNSISEDKQAKPDAVEAR